MNLLTKITSKFKKTKKKTIKQCLLAYASA